MPPKAKPTKRTTEDLLKIQKSLPPSIKCIEVSEKKADFYRDQGLVAGYLKKCPDTGSLRELMEKVSPLFEEFTVLHNSSWKINSPPSPEEEIPSGTQLLSFLDHMKHNEVASSIWHNEDTVPNPEIVKNVIDPCETKKFIMISELFVTLNILIKVMACEPEQFDQEAPHASDFAPNAENIHRAYALLHVWSHSNEKNRKSKGKGPSKVQNNKTKNVTYLTNDTNIETTDATQEIDTELEETLFMEFDQPSEPSSEDEADEGEKVIIDQPRDTSEKKVLDFNEAVKHLPPLTSIELASLHGYAMKRLTVKKDRWPDALPITVDEPCTNEEIGRIIHKVQDSVRREEAETKANLTTKSINQETKALEETQDNETLLNKVEDNNWFTLDHASMETMTLTKSCKYLGIEYDNLCIIPSVASSLVLLRHQVTAIATMLDLERMAYDCHFKDIPTLNAGMLGDNMGLGKTISILALVYFAHKLGLQMDNEDKRIDVNKPTIIVIPPACGLGWYLDYIQYFPNLLRIYFVGSSFRKGGDVKFQSVCIDKDLFVTALRTPQKSGLYRNNQDIGRTIFFVSHHTVTKYTLASTTQLEGEGEDLLAADNNPAPSSAPQGELESGVKRVRKKPAKTFSRTGTEDMTLTQEREAYETFLINYKSKVEKKAYRIIVDEGHVVRHPTSGISRAAKLSKADYLWVVFATPLLNKTRDFYGYSHLFYDTNWTLTFSEDWEDKSIIKKFRSASTPDKNLELFNPWNFRKLAVNGHINATTATLIIPILLRRCMIRRTIYSETDDQAVGTDIPAKHVNSVVLLMSRVKQNQYCQLHKRLTATSLGQPIDDDLNEERMNSHQVKTLMCTSFAPSFAQLHQRLGKKKVSFIVTKPFCKIETFLKYSCPNTEYQYHVPTTQVDQALNFINMSATIWYLTLILHQVVTVEKKHLTIFCNNPDVAWTVICFSMNWSAPTAWLCADITQTEHDHIISDFNNINGTLRVIVTTHLIEEFEINLHQSNCHHMMIIEFPRNINTLLQSCARLTRIDQLNEIFIWTIFVDHSFQRYWCSNLAQKTISDLRAQLRGKVKDEYTTDLSKINEHAEDALKVILNWEENRSRWNNIHELDLESSLLSSSQKKLFAEIKNDLSEIKSPSKPKASKHKREQSTPSKTQKAVKLLAKSGKIIVQEQHTHNPDLNHSTKNNHVVDSTDSVTESQITNPKILTENDDFASSDSMTHTLTHKNTGESIENLEDAVLEIINKQATDVHSENSEDSDMPDVDNQKMSENSDNTAASNVPTSDHLSDNAVQRQQDSLSKITINQPNSTEDHATLNPSLEAQNSTEKVETQIKTPRKSQKQRGPDEKFIKK